MKDYLISIIICQSLSVDTRQSEQSLIIIHLPRPDGELRKLDDDNGSKGRPCSKGRD